MKISASIANSFEKHEVSLETNGNRQSVSIAPKATGFGSSVNRGELLFLALATCYCNDIYREAAKREIKVERVEVSVEGDFGAEGEPAANIAYHVKISAEASASEIESLIRDTDRVAEIQNTLRIQTPVVLTSIEAVEV
ncbi:MAG TPA: OsmC family protein [Pyrinomonadaceae bacterium]|nr:OsmC family protein [Pyrinomonadaceae bacterium]